MKKYSLAYELNEEPREQSFDTEAERLAFVEDLKTNRAVSSLTPFDLVGGTTWTRPLEEDTLS